MWTCRCGEENEDQFAWCWKCGLPRPEERSARTPVPTPEDPPPANPARPHLRPRHAPKAFVLWCLAMYAVVYAFGPFVGEDGGWLFLVGSPLSAFLLIWVMTKGHNVPWREVLPLAAPAPGAVAASIVLSLGLAIVMAWSFDYVFLIPEVARLLEEWPANPASVHLVNETWLRSALATGIGAPLSEEAVFRGVMLSALLAGWPARRAVIVTALLFAVLHIHPIGMVTAFTLGVLAGWQRVVFGTLWLPVIAHAVFNAHVLLWIYTPRMPDWPTWFWLLVGIVLILVGYDRLVRHAPAPAYSRP